MPTAPISSCRTNDSRDRNPDNPKAASAISIHCPSAFGSRAKTLVVACRAASGEMPGFKRPIARIQLFPRLSSQF